MACYTLTSPLLQLLDIPEYLGSALYKEAFKSCSYFPPQNCVLCKLKRTKLIFKYSMASVNTVLPGLLLLKLQKNPRCVDKNIRKAK